MNSTSHTLIHLFHYLKKMGKIKCTTNIKDIFKVGEQRSKSSLHIGKIPMVQEFYKIRPCRTVFLKLILHITWHITVQFRGIINFTSRNLKLCRTHWHDMWWLQLDVPLPHLTTPSKDHCFKTPKMILTEAIQFFFLQGNSSQPVRIIYWQGRGLLRSVTKRPEVWHYTRRGTGKISAKTSYLP